MKKLVGFLVCFLLAAPTLALAQDVTGAGASFPYPVYSSWAFAYEHETKVKVNYQSIGSGGGIKQVTEGTVDFGASDEPQTSEQLQKANLLQFPAVLGGVTPIINLKGVTNEQLILSGQVLAEIYLGNVKKWNDPAIAELNPGLKLPSENINVLYRSDSSGTSAIFTTFLSSSNETWKSKVGQGKSVNWPVGVGHKGNDGVAGSAKRTENSIGYVEYAYASESGIDRVKLVNKAGKVVAPSAESFAAAAEKVEWDPKKDFYLWLVNAEGEGSWPMSAATFILIRRDKGESIAKVTTFFDWCFQKGDEEARRLQYVALPGQLKDSIRTYWQGFKK
jgi:phosphate transport system substrate-binding protein